MNWQFLAEKVCLPKHPGGYHIFIEDLTKLWKLNVGNGSMEAQEGLVQSVTGKAFLEEVPGKTDVYSFKHSQQTLYLSVNPQSSTVSFVITKSGWKESEFEFHVAAKQSRCRISTSLDGSYRVALYSVSAQKWVRLNEQKQLVADANTITEATELILAPTSVSPIFIE